MNFISICSIFPISLREEWCHLPQEAEELHLRRGRPASCVLAGENHRMRYVATPDELEEIFIRLCGGSVYAYRETLRQGYIPLPGGCRAGVVGRGVMEEGELSGVTDISSICFRFPHRVPGVADDLYRRWEADGERGGILICGGPGAGKTTLLRELIHRVSENRRTVVLDARRELCLPGVGTLLDEMTGYPPGCGMEIAVRTLSPEIIATDELGEREVAGALLCLRCGVPLFASVHGEGIGDLLARESVRALLERGAFRLLVTLWKEGRERQYLVEELSCSG